MSFFQSGAFWFFEGVLACLAVVAFKFWMEDRGVPMPWWKWFLVCFWVILLGVTLAFVGTSFGEGEPVAAIRGGVMFGVVTVIMGVVIWRLLHVGTKTSSAETGHETP